MPLPIKYEDFDPDFIDQKLNSFLEEPPTKKILSEYDHWLKTGKVPKNEAYESAKDFCISPLPETQAPESLVDRLKRVQADPYSFFNVLTSPQPNDRDRLLNLHEDLCGAARSTMAKKNKDYATDQDVFRNFRMFGGLGILVRASDKLARLRTFEERNEFSVSDESLRDTIEDLINYAVIYLAYKQEGK